MPTQHVQSGSDELLQGVANALLKARKVVVVTGAGISTNSGIPDFRSENGLYSLIQARFDAAAQQTRQVGAASGSSDDDDQRDDGPPSKRRKLSREASPESDPLPGIKDEIEVLSDTIFVGQSWNRDADDEVVDAITHSPATTSELPERPYYRTPQPKRGGVSAANVNTSPLSSPPPEDCINPPSAFRAFSHRRRSLRNTPLQLSSSPLSSPPPVLFDPFMPISPSDGNSSRRSSTSPSEVDETPPSSNLFTSSQASNSGKANLPNMKGRDLFDASIWADPLRTSVFYQFATSLRLKIKDAEPTGSHRFISHLRDRGKLVRCYTQNIDQIEEKVGLSTSLEDGPGSRGRFSRRSTANGSQLSKMVEEASGSSEPPTSSSDKNSDLDEKPCGDLTNASTQGSQTPDTTITSTVAAEGEPSSEATKIAPAKRGPARSGVECVFLHGSLELLRCFQCKKLCSWDDDDREEETLLGQQPECPHCVGATVAREEKGKRALGVGKLRPDIVLYGEEHPSSHLISPIVTHDLGLYPDMLLILGTSLRVHGLKVMVREFAKAVHSKGGCVVFVNFTKPSESSWGDIIDYWVQWDCDAWVTDLQSRVPKLWQEPEPPKPKKKRESSGMTDDAEKKEKTRPPAANPVALRDTKATGAYWTAKIISDLHKITGTPAPAPIMAAPVRRASTTAIMPAAPAVDLPLDTSVNALKKGLKAKTKRSRKSAPGALEKAAKRPSSTLNPNHGRTKKSAPATPRTKAASSPVRESNNAISSILNSVKENPRIRRRKIIDGEEVAAPRVGRKRALSTSSLNPRFTSPQLAPMKVPREGSSPAHTRLQPMEPESPPAGPTKSLPVDMRSANAASPGLSRLQADAFRIEDALLRSFPTEFDFNGTDKAVVLKSLNRTMTAQRTKDVVCAQEEQLAMGGASTVAESAMNGQVAELAKWGNQWDEDQCKT